MTRENTYYATGKRKNAIARTWLKLGTGEITINKRTPDNYFPVKTIRNIMFQALALIEAKEKYDIIITVRGGGNTGQAGAIRHGISRALLLIDPDLRGTLKKAGFIKRDARVKERKKYGQKGARARFQFSKR